MWYICSTEYLPQKQCPLCPLGYKLHEDRNPLFCISRAYQNFWLVVGIQQISTDWLNKYFYNLCIIICFTEKIKTLHYLLKVTQLENGWAKCKCTVLQHSVLHLLPIGTNKWGTVVAQSTSINPRQLPTGDLTSSVILSPLKIVKVWY